MLPKYVFEISFECGNKVGGIWRVITSKSKKMKEYFGENYYAIGFYNPNNIEYIEKDPPKEIRDIFDEFEDGEIIFGEWVYANSSNLILVNSKKIEKKYDKILYYYWEKFGIDSYGASYDYIEPMVWGYAVGKLLEMLYRKFGEKSVFHFHEWLSGGALLYLKDKFPKAKTVFTTHATVLGRSIGRYEFIFSGNFDPDNLAREKGVFAKHITEKTTARYSDVFTVVGDNLAKEVEIILGRKPDVVTYNGFYFKDKGEDLIIKKVDYREKIREFLRAYFGFYYKPELKDSLIVFTSGRYEYWNKGFDIFIEALSKLNKIPGKPIFAFILVPTGVYGYRKEVLDAFLTYKSLKENLSEIMEEVISRKDIEKFKEVLAQYTEFEKNIKRFEERNPPITPFELLDPNDIIVRKLKEYGLLNSKGDRVKVIYYPRYLNYRDEFLGLTYDEFVLGADVGVFPSRYEPWGYTALEAAYLLSISITTNKSGFGISLKGIDPWEHGIFVVDAFKEREEISTEICKILDRLSKRDYQRILEMQLNANEYVSRNYSWEILFGNYLRAYELAMS